MTHGIYADVEPEAKRDSIAKMKACFGLDMDSLFGEHEPDPHALPASGARTPKMLVRCWLRQKKRSGFTS